MDIEIYEDQTGEMFYPEKRTVENRDITRLFGNRVDLFIKKNSDNMEISCYALIQRGVERAIGCYITYRSNLSPGSTFANLKDIATKTLSEIGFKIANDKENALFNELEKFDMSLRQYNTNLITEALNSGNSLHYKGGSVQEIAGFCKEILLSVMNIKISISTETSELGEINILRNTTFEQRLVPDKRTEAVLSIQQDKIARKILDDKRKADNEIRKAEAERKKIENERKNKEKNKQKEIADNQFNEGFTHIEKSVDTLKRAGFIGNELTSVLTIYANRITNLFQTPMVTTPPEYKNSSKEEILDMMYEDMEKTEKEDKGGITGKQMLLIGTSVFLLGGLIGLLIVSGGLSTVVSKIMPSEIPTPVPTIEPTPQPTFALVIPTVTTEINYSNAANISNNTLINETNNTLINETNNTLINETNDTTNKSTNTSNNNSNALIGISPTPVRTPKLTPTPTSASTSNTSSDANAEQP